jgi:uncharacterized protein (DUF427 family)
MKLDRHQRGMKREQPRPGQESVWDYPRPPRLEPSAKTLIVSLAGQEIAKTSRAYRLLETSHPPTWYLPPDSVRQELLIATTKRSFCEWKGEASHWSVRVGNLTRDNAAWSYARPQANFKEIRGYFAFYAGLFDCYVNGELVKPQPGGFYGGWITKDIAGPFKGIPGSSGW